MADDAQLILVIDGDRERRDGVLRARLEASGFDTMGASSAIETYRSMLTRNYSLFIMDLALPDEDGFTLARNLRSLTNAGIIMLDGDRYPNVTRARGLNAGADAFVTKPVDLEVLTATVNSVLRRLEKAPASQPQTRVSGWQLNQDSWNLIAPGGKTIRLTHAERLFVDLLFASPSQTVERAAIVSHLTWSIRSFEPHRLEMLVHRLRRKVLVVAGEQLPLSAVRGIGYVLIPY